MIPTSANARSKNHGSDPLSNLRWGFLVLLVYWGAFVPHVVQGACSFAGQPFLADGSDLKSAVSTYAANPSDATLLANRGIIAEWCVENVMNFDNVFDALRVPALENTFNADISMWDVSSATSMRFMVRWG